MENTYSITVTNKFSLALDEDEDPLEILKIREQEKEAKKKEKLSEKENKSKHPQETQKPPATKTSKTRLIKDVQQATTKIQETKKDQGEKKPPQQRSAPGEREKTVKFETREERNNKRNQEDRERPPRGQQGEPREPRRGPPSENREPREFRPSNETQRDYGERRGRGGDYGERRGGRGPGRGRNLSRGSGPRGGFDNRGKREFDRQSGSDKTGIKPVDKKDGAGSHNWGTHNDEIEASMNQENQDWNADKPEPEVPQGSVEGKETETPADNSAEEKAAEPESAELTLDEWKALRSNRAAPQFNTRKAGEGEDLTRWRKMYALEKKKEGEEDDEDEEDYDATVEYPQRAGRLKRVVGIEFQFTDSRRNSGGRGRGRGGRGGGGGGGGGGGDRPNNRGFGGNRGAHRDTDFRGPPAAPQVEQRSPRGQQQSAPKVDDEHDFPSLG